MSTLFGRHRKHRSRTESAGSDGHGDALGSSSLPYEANPAPAVPPLPRQSIAGDAPRSSVYSMTVSEAQQSQPSGSGSGSTPARQREKQSQSFANGPKDITAPVHLIPESLPYGQSLSRTRTPDLHRNTSHASTDGGRSIRSAASSSSQPRKSQVADRSLNPANQARRGSSASNATMNPIRDFDPQSSRSSSRNGHHSIATASSRGSNHSHGRATSPPPAASRSSLAPAGQYPAYPYSGASSSSRSAENVTNMRASHASSHSVSSQRSSSSLNTTVNTSIATPSLAASEFSFPRPKQDEDIEYLFQNLLERTAVPLNKRADASRLHISKKWAMVYNDKLQEWQNARKKPPPLDRMSSHGTPVLPGSPKPEATPVVQQSANILAAAAAASRTSTETAPPEWYLTKFMDGSIQPATVSSLRVALRTYPIAWVEAFVLKLQGLSVLTNALANITRLPIPRKENDLKLELEIVKCLKDLLQRSQIGLDAALHYPHCIFSVVLDISSPNVQARKLVMDMLIFLAYQKKGEVTGHNYVLRGLDNLMNIRGDHGRFDAWFTILESTLDGRGKMGSLVGASEEIRTLRGREAQAAMQAVNGPEGQHDSALTEYCVRRRTHPPISADNFAFSFQTCCSSMLLPFCRKSWRSDCIYASRWKHQGLVAYWTSSGP